MRACFTFPLKRYCHPVQGNHANVRIAQNYHIILAIFPITEKKTKNEPKFPFSFGDQYLNIFYNKLVLKMTKLCI